MSLKSPEDIADNLVKQWARTEKRRELFNAETLWPIRIKIGKPTPQEISTDPNKVKSFLGHWRDMKSGHVTWTQIKYRGLADELEIPESLELASAIEWIAATRHHAIQLEFRKLQNVLDNTDIAYHTLLIGRRQLVNNMTAENCIKAVEVASLLSPGCAKGIPLRGITLAGVDTKFIERNLALITDLLDIRFAGTVKPVGLEKFLGTIPSDFHWILVVDLDGDLLPMERIRVRDTELLQRELPCRRVLIVENEQCLHLIPRLKDTIAILGAGLNLSWLSAPWLNNRILGYWGDIDTWGMTMLATARMKQPGITALLMSQDIFSKCADKCAVVEPVPAALAAPQDLQQDEKLLYERLIAAEKGRLEQEFLPEAMVHDQLLEWVRSHR
jgi:hypothetical protein